MDIYDTPLATTSILPQLRSSLQQVGTLHVFSSIQFATCQSDFKQDTEGIDSDLITSC